MLLLLFVSLFTLSFGQTWHHTGHISWRDCGTHDDWVKVTKFDLEPNPIVLPGDLFVTLEGNIKHQLGNQVSMDIIVEKNLLGTWVTVPCSGAHYNVGTCHYTYPCNYLHTFELSGQCPVQLSTHGIQCTCPFNPSTLHLPRARFHVNAVTNGFEQFLRDMHQWRVTIKLNDKHHGHVERMCIEAKVFIHVK